MLSFFRILRYQFTDNLLRSLVWCRLRCTQSIIYQRTAVSISRSSHTIPDSRRGLTAGDTMSATVRLIIATYDDTEDECHFHKLEPFLNQILTVLSTQHFIICLDWSGVAVRWWSNRPALYSLRNTAARCSRPVAEQFDLLPAKGQTDNLQLGKQQQKVQAGL